MENKEKPKILEKIKAVIDNIETKFANEIDEMLIPDYIKNKTLHEKDYYEGLTNINTSITVLNFISLTYDEQNIYVFDDEFNFKYWEKPLTHFSIDRKNPNSFYKLEKKLSKINITLDDFLNKEIIMIGCRGYNSGYNDLKIFIK